MSKQFSPTLVKHKVTQIQIVAGYIVIGLVALALRVVDLGGFVTIDEAKFWLPRSERFLHALYAGDSADMPIVSHPGVTTMWLGAAGIVLRNALFDSGVVQQETYATLLSLHRLPVALVHTAGILVGYGLLRRLFAPSVAFLAAFFWATDPFVLAFSRILHVDALVGTFATVSILAACVAHRGQGVGGRGQGVVLWFALSGMCAALAFLSKLPGLAVLPIVAGLALATVIEDTSRLRHVVRGLVVWGIAYAATLVVLWPVVWSDPMRVYETLRFGVESEGGEPHMWGNFFMGAVQEVPGPLFYPVALAMRTTPWVLFGVLVLPLAMLSVRAKLSGETIRMLAVLSAFVLVFVVGMSLFAKKMNRYLVPAFPALTIIAAVGVVWAIEGLRIARLARRILLFFLPIAAVVLAVWFHPYHVAYFNPLLGGARAGARTFLTGWGEGFGQVAAWLNAQPDSRSVVTLTSLPSVLNPYLERSVYASADARNGLPESIGYVVVYISHAQRHLAQPYDAFYGHAVPVHTVTIHGVDYAWIYQVPRAMPHALEADFGPAMGVHGYGLDTSAVYSSGVLTLTMQWHVAAPIAEDYNLFVHVLNDDGERVGQLDVPLRDPHVPTSAWQAGRFVWWVHPVMVPADMPPGRYRVALGVYNPDDGARLPLRFDAEWQARHDIWQGKLDDGAHALFLEPVMIE